MAQTFLQWGADHLAATLLEHAAEPVTYVRYAGSGLESAHTFKDVPAWAAGARKLTVQPTEVTNADVAAGYLTFYVRVADFPAKLKDDATAPPCPREGDWIVRVENGRKVTYEVLPLPYGNDPAWRHADAGRTVFRMTAMLCKVQRIWPSP